MANGCSLAAFERAQRALDVARLLSIGEDGRGQAHVAEVILCDMEEMDLLSHSLPIAACEASRQ